ncbi:MAG: LysR family transcriptional regulator [Hoeflea sp.]|uniref:LysR family transcriptional regulator n=1 Tax=Hoeflea sp. TaxID=1940281 RepID=UPI001D2B3D24|nr:LysR family transcriptional regulator [Hoeflea sp.]MBU4530473.1 LysR family transcriptional regulator [Alphaproteobacteria bacterium]MBU4545260.1 LysR family transcriptional regulator [Alphaproteobacteria bacterium]MBU4548909.1 LysR family transcriptional regulator [Alphaproteobacteria bacterium]MBV1722064.1 LysR family transcriptional regulator [Hoeflea sp.]MBV1761414.1 LysR family transcriptional regulator [Hoeflea sp.]
MADANWDDLQLFYQVAEQGGLSAAAAGTGLSAPTIGRRMLALERALGRSLFIRSQQGYRLAHDGQILLERVRVMRQAADGIADWHGDAFALPLVSIATEPWLAPFVAESIAAIRSPSDAFRLCVKTADADLDMTFRAADVAVLGVEPVSGNLAKRRSVTFRYAVYRSRALAGAADLPWISVGTESARSNSDRFVFENHESQILTWTGEARLVETLVQAGAGRGVLPVFAGDANPAIEREGDIIAALDHPLWIVANDDDRRRPEVRLVIDRVAELFSRHAARFLG